MIHVELQPEPADFDAKVRRPGRAALASGKTPLPELWRLCLLDLHAAYRGICAYLCIYIPRGTGARTVDHLAAKSDSPDLAYEWSNYRLACGLMNARKREFADVLDPFDIDDDLFVLEFSFFQVSPAPGLSPAKQDAVLRTIDRLKLNDEECRAARAQYYDVYIDGSVRFEYVDRHSPFVAREMRRQGLLHPADVEHAGP